MLNFEAVFAAVDIRYFLIGSVSYLSVILGVGVYK